MQWNQHPCEEELVLFLQWQRKSVDDGTENLKKFSDAIESFSLVDELEEDVVDRATDVRAKVEELSVDAVKSSLKEVAFSWVFRIE
jgi:hypothetical protein